MIQAPIQPFTQERTRDLMPFIPAVLDDYGLPSDHFRIFCHIARRGEARGGIANIAKVCLLSDRQVQKCLRVLVSLQLVQEETVENSCKIFSVRPPSEWLAPDPGMFSPVKRARKKSVTTDRSEGGELYAPPHELDSGGELYSRRGEYYSKTGELYAPKGTPIEGTPIEGTPEERKNMSHDESSDAIAPKQKKASKSKKKRQQRSEPERFAIEFNDVWTSYYQFALRVQCSAGSRAEAAIAWDERFEGMSPEEALEEVDRIQEGTDWYTRCKLVEFSRRGQAIGVAHMVRYLRNRKDREALDHKLVQQQVEQQAQAEIDINSNEYDWESDPRYPQWVEEIEREGPGMFVWLEGSRTPHRDAFERWYSGRNLPCRR